MPELGGQPAREPAIAMASDLCFPDETLVLTGDHLSGAVADLGRGRAGGR